MDENMILMSWDVVRFVTLNAGVGYDKGVDSNVTYQVENGRSDANLLAFDGQTTTFAVNLAFWTHFLNLTIFDDRSRIDAQQMYLTKFMVCVVFWMMANASTRRLTIQHFKRATMVRFVIGRGTHTMFLVD
jgi:hypothetical protein